MKFEVGKSYWAYDRSYDYITVLNRTPKCINVRGTSGNKWRMFIRVDENGTEYAIDSATPKRWREAFTYSADNPVE